MERCAKQQVDKYKGKQARDLYTFVLGSVSTALLFSRRAHRI